MVVTTVEPIVLFGIVNINSASTIATNGISFGSTHTIFPHVWAGVYASAPHNYEGSRNPSPMGQKAGYSHTRHSEASGSNRAHTLLEDEQAYEKMSKAVNPYGDGKACERIV